MHMQFVVRHCYFHVLKQIQERFVGWWASSIYALQSINRMEIAVVGENIERQPDGKEVSVQAFPAFRIMDWEWAYKVSEGKLSSLSSPVNAVCWRQQCLTKCMVCMDIYIITLYTRFTTKEKWIDAAKGLSNILPFDCCNLARSSK